MCKLAKIANLYLQHATISPKSTVTAVIVIVELVVIPKCFLLHLPVESSWRPWRYTSKWSKDVEVHCIGRHQLVSVPFLLSLLTIFLFKEFFPLPVRNLSYIIKLLTFLFVFQLVALCVYFWICLKHTCIVHILYYISSVQVRTVYGFECKSITLQTLLWKSVLSHDFWQRHTTQCFVNLSALLKEPTYSIMAKFTDIHVASTQEMSTL